MHPRTSALLAGVLLLAGCLEKGGSGGWNKLLGGNDNPPRNGPPEDLQVDQGKVTLKRVPPRPAGAGDKTAFQPQHYTRWLGQKRNVPFDTRSEKVMLVAAAYRGKLNTQDAGKAFDEAVRVALDEGFFGEYGGQQGAEKRVAASDELFVFGYYNLTTRRGEWVAVFPRLRDSGGKTGCQRLLPDGRTARNSGWAAQTWSVDGRKLAIHFADDDRGGLVFNFSPPA